MRPTLAELITGITRTLNSFALPIVLNSGDREAFWEVGVLNRLLSYIKKRWKNEFGRLARENTALEGLLREAAAALRPLGHPEAPDLERILDESHCEIADLPPIEALEEQNLNVKRGLERFIIAHAAMPEGGPPELQAVRRKIRGYLKEINQRDFKAAQALIFFS